MAHPLCCMHMAAHELRKEASKKLLKRSLPRTQTSRATLRYYLSSFPPTMTQCVNYLPFYWSFIPLLHRFISFSSSSLWLHIASIHRVCLCTLLEIEMLLVIIGTIKTGLALPTNSIKRDLSYSRCSGVLLAWVR